MLTSFEPCITERNCGHTQATRRWRTYTHVLYIACMLISSEPLIAYANGEEQRPQAAPRQLAVGVRTLHVCWYLT